MRELLTANKVLFSAIGGIIGSIFGELDGFSMPSWYLWSLTT